MKALDHAQQNLLDQLRRIRQANRDRPVLLVLTCLHEAYPQQQHPSPYPYGTTEEATAVPENLRRSLEAQRQRFAGLVDRVVPVDLTPPEEGFAEPNFGGSALQQAVLEVLPAAYRLTFLTVEEASRSLSDLYARHTLPYVIFYSLLAGTAGAFPYRGWTCSSCRPSRRVSSTNWLRCTASPSRPSTLASWPARVGHWPGGTSGGPGGDQVHSRRRLGGRHRLGREYHLRPGQGGLFLLSRCAEGTCPPPRGTAPLLQGTTRAG